MVFRLAEMNDLPQIKSMYREIVRQMDANGIRIWDDVYPCEFFEADIQNGHLYLLLDGGALVSAFALCPSSAGESHVAWRDSRARALYLDRLGVNTAWAGKGVGSLMLAKAAERAKALGAEYLRLFVVDSNTPAIRLYQKNGFTQAGGVYNEVIDKECTLQEYGFEINLHLLGTQALISRDQPQDPPVPCDPGKTLQS